MKFKTLMMIKAGVCLILGIPILFVPEFFYGIFGIALTAGGVFVAREYGASLMGNMLLAWFAKDAHESDARRAIIWALCVYDAVGFVATTVFVLAGGSILLGWVAALLYLFLAIGYGYFLVKPPKP